jgi:hypothetical protein
MRYFFCSTALYLKKNPLRHEKNTTLYFYFLSLRFLFSYGQKQNDWTKLELKGRVKSLKTSFTYRSEKEGKLTEWQSAQDTLILFDKNGYLTKKLNYKEDGSLFLHNGLYTKCRFAIN